MATLAIRAGALGDTIVTIPALRALESVSSRLEFVGTAPYTELVPADETHSIDRARFRALFDPGADDGELEAFVRQFGRVVAWTRAPLNVAGVELVQSPPFPPDGVHASDHLMAALTPLGIEGPAPPPTIEPDATLTGYPASFVAIHPGSGSPSKNWLPENFEAIARLALAQGHGLVWIEGEADAAVVSHLAQRVPGTVARQLPLGELGAVLARASVYVGNDSGVSHLAAAVGAPTVAVFRSTDPRQWAPRGSIVQVAHAGASPEAVWGFACNLMDRR